jgi:hypothetical protein
MSIFILFSMIFCHIIADFHIQNNFMAKFKQKREWRIGYGNNYLSDWIPVLAVHAFSWSFFTFLPLLYYVYTKDITFYTLSGIILLNAIVHFIVDDQKCNRFNISLIVDQEIHILQIVLTFIVMILVL